MPFRQTWRSPIPRRLPSAVYRDRCLQHVPSDFTLPCDAE